MRLAWLVILALITMLDLWCWRTGRLTLTRLIVHALPRWWVLLGGLLVLWHLLTAYDRTR